jgi:hypothetical protein
MGRSQSPRPLVGFAIEPSSVGWMWRGVLSDSRCSASRPAADRPRLRCYSGQRRHVSDAHKVIGHVFIDGSDYRGWQSIADAAREEAAEMGADAVFMGQMGQYQSGQCLCRAVQRQQQPAQLADLHSIPTVRHSQAPQYLGQFRESS